MPITNNYSAYCDNCGKLLNTFSTNVFDIVKIFISDESSYWKLDADNKRVLCGDCYSNDKIKCCCNCVKFIKCRSKVKCGYVLGRDNKCDKCKSKKRSCYLNKQEVANDS